MKASAALLTFAFLAGTSAHSLAAATPDEAQRLTALFQSYLGSEPGVVKVEPAGESYTAIFDLAPYINKIKEPGASATVSPVQLTLTGQGGGKWKVDQDQPFALTLKVDGKIDLKMSLGSIKGTGVFDEALGTMESSATDFSQLAVDQVITENGNTSKVAYTIAGMHYESTLSGTADGADGTVKSNYTDLRETISMPAAPDGSTPPMDFSIASTSGTNDGVLKGVKPKAITEIAAWFVAHPSKDAIIADQAQLKDKIRAALPLFASISATGTMNDLSVNTMLGQFGLQKIDVQVDANGVVENGALREKLTISGLKMPDGVVPPWAASLVPQTFTIDFNIADFNLAAPAKLMIDNFDLAKEPPLPPEIEQQLQQALLPKGTVTMGLGPSEIVASIFDLKAEGSMTAGPAAMPAGQATIKLKGIDDIMAAIQAAPPEMGMQQMAPMVIVAKGMAKPDGDYLSWKIESTPQGSFTVNGVDPMKMGGQ